MQLIPKINDKWRGNFDSARLLCLSPSFISLSCHCATRSTNPSALVKKSFQQGWGTQRYITRHRLHFLSGATLLASSTMYETSTKVAEFAKSAYSRRLPPKFRTVLSVYSRHFKPCRFCFSPLNCSLSKSEFLSLYSRTVPINRSQVVSIRV
jgi:hypothetical protein